jgi:phosphohistidine phosphatase
MKTLLLIRHAKSSWDDFSLADFDRPLNNRGKADAPKMAERLYDKKIKIDSFISSPAKRAKKTAEMFAERYGVKKSDVILAPALYEASETEFLHTIANAPAFSSTIAVFSHNPGITDFANSLTTSRIDDMPTCSVFAVKVDTEDWSGFKNAAKEFYFFDFPKSGSGD